VYLFLLLKVVGDGSMIVGWEKALRSMTVGERAVIRISDPTLGYGPAGVPPLIPPNAELEFDVEILDTQPPTANIDFDSLAMADNTPVSKVYTLLQDGLLLVRRNVTNKCYRFESSRFIACLSPYLTTSWHLAGYSYFISCLWIFLCRERHPTFLQLTKSDGH
jgi:hypothetical protein